MKIRVNLRGRRRKECKSTCDGLHAFRAGVPPLLVWLPPPRHLLASVCLYSARLAASWSPSPPGAR